MRKAVVECLVAAMAGALAYASQAIIYASLIVPRLPEWTSVPGYWWAIALSPIALLLAGIAYAARYRREVVMWSSAALLPWRIGRGVYSLVAQRPIGHDLWATDAHYWIASAMLLALGVGLSLLCHALLRFARRPWSPPFAAGE